MSSPFVAIDTKNAYGRVVLGAVGHGPRRLVLFLLEDDEVSAVAN